MGDRFQNDVHAKGPRISEKSWEVGQDFWDPPSRKNRGGWSGFLANLKPRWIGPFGAPYQQLKDAISVSHMRSLELQALESQNGRPKYHRAMGDRFQNGVYAKGPRISEKSWG